VVWQAAQAHVSSLKQEKTDMSHESRTKSRIISMASILTAGFLGLAGVAVGGTAQSAEKPVYDKIIVNFGDLNLDSPQGTQALYARLRNSAEDVCSSVEGRDLFFKRIWQSCFDQAVAAAVMQVNKPGLTTLYNQTIKRPKG
jgi:UrcA family protein